MSSYESIPEELVKEITDWASKVGGAFSEDPLRQHVISGRTLFGQLNSLVEKMVINQVRLLEDLQAREAVNLDLQSQVDEMRANNRALLSQVANATVPIPVPSRSPGSPVGEVDELEDHEEVVPPVSAQKIIKLADPPMYDSERYKVKEIRENVC